MLGLRAVGEGTAPGLHRWYWRPGWQDVGALGRSPCSADATRDRPSTPEGIHPRPHGLGTLPASAVVVAGLQDHDVVAIDEVDEPCSVPGCVYRVWPEDVPVWRGEFNWSTQH